MSSESAQSQPCGLGPSDREAGRNAEPPAVFRLDTSGFVRLRREGPWGVADDHAWSDLDPFTQGYIEALFADLDRARMARYRAAAWGSKERAVPIRAAFHWLAPETLARIMEDCGVRHSYYAAQHEGIDKHAGLKFWRDRSVGCWAHAGQPPLAPYLGRDGKIYLRDQSASEGSDAAQVERESSRERPPLSKGDGVSSRNRGD